MQLEQRRLRRVAADDVARGLVLLERTLQVGVWRWRCGGGVVVVVWGSVHLEGVARQRELVLRERQRLAGGDAELPLDEVDARHLQRSGVSFVRAVELCV